METAKLQRQWNIEDRDEARAYGIQELAEVREYSRNAYSHLVQDAETAGINPLTALRNGGGAGYSAAYGQSPGFAPLSRQAPTRQAPLLNGMGNAVSQAGNQIADFMANFDPHRDAAREDGARLINAQVANLEANTAATLAQTRQIEFRPSGRAATLSNPKVNKAANTAVLAKGGDPESGSKTVTNPWMDHEVNPYFLDAETFEARYGDSEIAQMIYGTRNMIADHFWNTERAIRSAMPEYQRRQKAKQKANQSRQGRISRAARRNADDLMFPPALR